MIALESKLEGQTYQLYKLEQILKPLGYDIGGNWDYETGSFDYKIDDKEGYQFLRLPFEAVSGQLDAKGTMVRIGTPYLLSHVYQENLDDNVNTFTAGFTSLDQFSEPKDPDGKVDEKYVDVGKALLRELEDALITS
ncbi:YugN-like family protein [Ectobacillus sp. JY-23]|uniref:YugN-like family protein n=1 Tax=Ectobacillus sp. JY-23 TaxID=2933872 RepID=UPI001FF5B0EE|nr:YugN-like family protein [Ectobacillus sp. JY-23]UOY90943.1 YugN-like family protein [Ectobacillus sp. JY-23]